MLTIWPPWGENQFRKILGIEIGGEGKKKPSRHNQPLAEFI
jgi:hypothetical protein